MGKELEGTKDRRAITLWSVTYEVIEKKNEFINLVTFMPSLLCGFKYLKY